MRYELAYTFLIFGSFRINIKKYPVKTEIKQYYTDLLICSSGQVREIFQYHMKFSRIN